MTSRVQKGGAIFRPVARARGGSRSTVSRQSTVFSETAKLSGPEDPVSEPVALISEINTPGIQPHETPITDSQMDSIQITHAPPQLQISGGAAPIAIPVTGRIGVRAHAPIITPTQSLGLDQAPTVNIHADEGDFPVKHPLTENATLGSDSASDQEPSAQHGQTATTKTEGVSKRKRIRKKGTSEADEDNIDEEDGHQVRKKRRSRGESVPSFDHDADPGEDIDPTVVTMAEICHDTGRGRISSKAALIINNHATWKASNKEKRDRMRMAMELRKKGREEEANTLLTGSIAETPKETVDEDTAIVVKSVEDGREATPTVDESGEGFDYSQTVVAQNHNPQVRLGPNGQVILDEESTYIDRGPGADDMAGYTHIVESDYTKFVNSGTYGRKLRGHRWSADETETFYDALGQFGENYELISMLLPGRDRKACKNKFKAEDKRNPERINYTLKNGIPVDIHTLSQRSGRDFSGPTPEINIPAATLLQAEKGHSERNDTTSHTHQHKPRRRSRSRAAVLEEGLQVVGGIDDVQFED